MVNPDRNRDISSVESQQPQTFSPAHKTWWGRLLSWCKHQAPFIGRRVSSLMSQKSYPQETHEEQGQIKQKFHDNYHTILSLNKQEIKYLQAHQGRLVKSDTPTTPSQQQEVKSLIQQTYRQAWGKLIDAQHGYCIQEQAMQDLNNLKDQLVAIYPEAIPTADPEKPLSILTRTYRNPQAVSLPAELEKVRTEKYNETTQTVSELAKRQLSYQDLEGLDKGMNPTQFISDAATGKKIAIAKSVNELGGLAQEVANQQGVEDASVFEFLGGFHELLASHLNVLLDGRLGIPLATEKEDTTVHAFIKNEGNFHDFIETHGKEAIKELPVESSQRFVFAQLVTRNKDCHGENILFTPTGDPIAIDFGRILDPDSPLRACYLEFSCLDKPINKEDRIFYSHLDVEQTMQKLTDALQSKYADQFKDPVTHQAIMTRLDLLKGRLYMIKMGVEAGLNQRQLLALDLPPITSKLEKIYRMFKDAGNQWPDEDEEPPSDLFGGPSMDWFGGYLARKGFQAAWNSSFDAQTHRLQTTAFLKALQREIDSLKKIPLDKLYTAREKELYTTANYDWTEMPRLNLSE